MSFLIKLAEKLGFLRVDKPMSRPTNQDEVDNLKRRVEDVRCERIQAGHRVRELLWANIKEADEVTKTVRGVLDKMENKPKPKPKIGVRGKFP